MSTEGVLPTGQLSDIGLTSASSGLEAMFDAPGIASIIGEINNEARCISIFATPTTRTPMGQINENLRMLGAFDIESHRRFNVQGILTTMPDVFVTLVKDPTATGDPRESWAQKNNGAFGRYISGFSGALLGYSHDHNRSLRTIIGEKKRMEGDKADSVETRLGILTAVQLLSQESPTGTFDKKDLFDIVDSYGIDIPIARKHIERLTYHKVIERNPRTNKKLRTLIKPDGGDSYDDVADLMRVIADFVIASPRAIARGQETGRQILHDNPRRLAMLVRRSYATSTHTGKSTRRRTA